MPLALLQKRMKEVPALYVFTPCMLLSACQVSTAERRLCCLLVAGLRTVVRRGAVLRDWSGAQTRACGPLSGAACCCAAAGRPDVEGGCRGSPRAPPSSSASRLGRWPSLNVWVTFSGFSGVGRQGPGLSRSGTVVRRLPRKRRPYGAR